MTAFTVRLRDEKYVRLKELAREQKISVNRLIDELATLYLAEQDLEVRFQARALRGKGKVERGLDLLAKAQGKSSPDSR